MKAEQMNTSFDQIQQLENINISLNNISFQIGSCFCCVCNNYQLLICNMDRFPLVNQTEIKNSGKLEKSNAKGRFSEMVTESILMIPTSLIKKNS